jgi:hypothetical protein
LEHERREKIPEGPERGGEIIGIRFAKTKPQHQ